MFDSMSNNKEGWISLNRSMRDHWIWADKRKFSKAEAWIDLLMSANHQEAKVLIKGKLITCKRGDTLQSLETLGAKWTWKRDAVRRFLKLLENDGMIRYANATVTSHISICNYDTYQSQQKPNAQQVRRKCDGDATDARTNNNDNNENKNVSVEKNCEEQQRKSIFKANKGYFNECDFNQLWAKFVWVCEQNRVAFTETRWNTFTKKK